MGFMNSKENEWVLNKAELNRELADTVKARKLAYYGHYARNNARYTQAKKTTHGLDGQHQYVDGTPLEESIRMTGDRDKWRKYVDSVANPRVENGLKEQNRIITLKIMIPVCYIPSI